MGCLSVIIGFIGFLIIFIRRFLDMEDSDFLFYLSVILSVIGLIPLFILQVRMEQNKENKD